MLVDVEQLSEYACGLVAGKGGCRNISINPCAVLFVCGYLIVHHLSLYITE